MTHWNHWMMAGLVGVGLVPGLPELARSPRLAGTIEGRVVDQTGAGIGGASVAIRGGRLAVSTGADGRYRLEAVSVGEVELIARAIGYRASAKTVRVREGAVTTADFALTADVNRLEEVVTTADRSAKSSAGFAVGAVAAPSIHRRAGGRDFNTEEYRHIAENSWRAPGRTPLSTFSIDVDAGSYTNVRRFLSEGRLPPVDAVRVEEMINYFRYDYREPSGEHPFSVTTEVTDAPWHPGHKLALIGLQGRRIPVASLPPSNLVFLIDVSGSMHDPRKLPLVKSAFRLLVNQLRPEDRVAIAVYAGAAGLVLPSTPGNRKDRILDAIERLQAGGSTAGAAGIRLAYQTAKEHFLREGNNRVILATDGDFNVGVSSEGELIRLIEEERRHGIFLTVLGFGTGNLKDAKMEQLADKGNGHYAYVDNLLEARKVLVQEMGATLVTIAKDVKLQVEFNPETVQAYRLIGYENRLLADEDFNDDTKDAGDMGAGHSVTALYELVPVGAPLDVKVGTVDPLRYQAPRNGGRARDTQEDWFTVKLRYKAPESAESRLLDRVVRGATRTPSENLRWASAVAGVGMLLRDSEHKGRTTWQSMLSLARGARGEDREGYRGEFVRLAEMAEELKRGVSGER
jgi:Ca-activated chloride channel family protein